MLIESVSVKHFGLLHHFDVKLGDKLNVIEGSNESGKSTLSAFIRFMLYGFPSDEAGLDERRRRTSWDSGTAEGEMVVSVKGRRYRIERYSAIIRNLAGGEEFRDRTRTIDVAEGSLVTEIDAGEYFLGVPNAVYVSSAFISQLDDTRVGEDKMLDQISSILFSGDERRSAERASEMLRRRRDKLIAAAGEQGDLSRLRQRAAELVEERERAVEVNRLLLRREAELIENQKKKKAVEAELSKLEKIKNSFKTVAVINNFDKLHNLEREEYLLDGEEAEFRLRHTKNGFFPDTSYRTELTINRRVAGDSYAAYKSAQEELVTLREEQESCLETERVLFRIDRHGGDEKVKAGLSAICKNAMTFFAAAALFAMLAALFVVLGAATALPMSVGAIIGVILLLVGAGALIPAFARRRRAREYALDFGFASPREFSRFLDRIVEVREAARVRTRALRRAEEMLERAKKTYLASHASLSETVGRWGRTLPEVGVGAVIDGMIGEIDLIMKEVEVYSRRKTEMREAIALLRGKLGGEDETLLRESLSPEIRDTLCDMSYEEILQGISSRSETLEAIEREYIDLSDEIDGLRGAAVNPIELDEKIHTLTAEITELRELQQALTLAYDAVSGAEENLRREITPRLSEYARRLMSSMTDGKYDEVGVSDQLMLDFARGQERRSVEFLSGGTRDLAYIALRLAYIDLLYKEAPPLVFDESFAHQDNFRATCTMKALRALADEGVQSLIFTCRSRESTIAREVDRKYKHIKIEKLRAEAEAALALAVSEEKEPEAPEMPIIDQPSVDETLTFAVPSALLEAESIEPVSAGSVVEETVEDAPQSAFEVETFEAFLSDDDAPAEEEETQEEPIEEDLTDEELAKDELVEEIVIEEDTTEEDLPDEIVIEEDPTEEDLPDEIVIEEDPVEEDLPDEIVIEEDPVEEDLPDEIVIEEEPTEEELAEEIAIEEDYTEEDATEDEASEDPLAAILGESGNGEQAFDLSDVLDSLYVMQDGETEFESMIAEIPAEDAEDDENSDAEDLEDEDFVDAEDLEDEDFVDVENLEDEELSDDEDDEDDDAFVGTLWSPAKEEQIEDADDIALMLGSYAEGEDGQ